MGLVAGVSANRRHPCLLQLLSHLINKRTRRELGPGQWGATIAARLQLSRQSKTDTLSWGLVRPITVTALRTANIEL